MDEVSRPRALDHKRPAEIMPYDWEIVSAPAHQRHSLQAEVNRLADRGEVAILGPAVWRRERGQWEIRVRRLKPAPPRWRKPVLIGTAVAGTLGALLAAGWWALSTLALIPGAVFLVLFLIVFVGCVIGSHDRRGTSVNVSVSTTVNVRVR